MTDKRGYGAGLTRSREASQRGDLASVLQISEEGVGQLAEAKTIAIERIEANPDQPRREFSDATILELADSIKTRGVLQPIRVRRHGDNFQIIAGERRFRAAQLAGLRELPAVVVVQDDDNAYIDALIENIQREDLNPVDRGKAIARLYTNLAFESWDQVAKLLGMSRQSVHNLVTLPGLPLAIQEDIRSGELTEKHGRALLRLKHQPELQLEAFRRIVDEKLTGDESISFVRELRQSIVPNAAAATSPALSAARALERNVDALDIELDAEIADADRRAMLTILRRAAARLEAALSRLSE